MAEAALRDLLIVGVAGRKVLIDPEEFTAWCELRNEKNDASARARFVSAKLRGADNEMTFNPCMNTDGDCTPWAAFARSVEGHEYD